MLFLKEHRQIALHVACGDITDVALDGNNFIINIEDGMMQNLLNEGKREIESALRWQGLDLNVIFFSLYFCFSFLYCSLNSLELSLTLTEKVGDLEPPTLTIDFSTRATAS